MTENEFLNDLTNEQRDAVLKFDGDISVTANAGSGKTTLLVRKYLYLQLFHPEKYNHRNVVAITFTKKAASEILKKIRETIIDLLGVKTNTENSKRIFENVILTKEQIDILNEINKNLINLKVSTIHHFCRVIIKDFSFRVGLQPNLTILDESEQSLLVNKIIVQVLSEKNNSLYPHIVKATQFLGFQNTIDYLAKLLEKNNLHQQMLKFYSMPFESIKEDISIKLKSIYLYNIELILKDLYQNVDSYDEIIKVNAENFKSTIENFNNSDNTQKSFYELYTELENIRTFKKGKGNAHISKLILQETDFKIFYNIITSLKSLQEKYDEEDLLLENRISIGLALTKISIEIYKKYSEINFNENKIDNDTSIDLTVQLLQNEKVLEIVQSDLSYLMIDEFQDTDDRQLEIANQIRKQGKVKLFVVGDDKQGIYGFRNADVRVFKNLRDELPKENQLNLTTSFRSKIEINAFVNDLFAPFMNSEKSEYDVDYHKIITADSTPSANENRINILRSNKKNHNQNNDSSIGMDQQLIKSLHQLINENEISPGDICILASSGNDLKAISNLLNQKGLESVILSSRGFYSKNEVKELIAFVIFIDDKDNDILCAATLKSSLFNYTDNNLFQICNQTDSKKSLWERFQDYANQSKDSFDKNTVEILRNAIKLSNKLPISNILIKVIDESNWNYYYQNDKNQKSAFNNLYKFMGIARSLEDRSYGGMAELMDLLDHKFKINRDSEEIGDISNAIKLSTIHSAKGMEYKHVIIYNFNMFYINSGSRSNTIDERYGIKMKIPTSINDYSQFALKESLIDILINENQKIAAFAENKRLYYVAITRAINTLHLLINDRSKEQILALKSTIGIEEQTTKISKKTSIEILDINTKEILPTNIEYNINFDFDMADIENYTFGQKEVKMSKSKTPVNSYLGTVDTTEKDINFSATKLAMLEDIKDKEKFREIYIYGIPNPLKQNLNYDIDENENQSNKVSDGTEYGIFFHSLMENINSIIDEEQNIIPENLSNTITNTELEYELHCNDITREKLIYDLKAILKSDIIKHNMDILINSEKEYELKMAFGDHTLQAIYDAIYFVGNTAEIWDWKTNKFSEKESLDLKAQKYKLQMDMYALFAFKYKPEIEIVNSRLFFIEKVHSATGNGDWIYNKTYTRADINKIQIQLAEKIGIIKERYPNTYPVKPVIL